MSINKYFLSLFLSIGLASSFAPIVFAQQSYEIKDMTPEIKEALDNRRSRFDELKTWKAKGVVGENNQGYVEVLEKGSEASSLVDAENKDRRYIYKQIVTQNNLGNDALPTVEAVFAQVQRDKASPGEKVQDQTGNWATK